jgi:CubicO group peptidase (beta-lactamase class C family)
MNSFYRRRIGALGRYLSVYIILGIATLEAQPLEEKIDAFLEQAYANRQFNGNVLVATQGEVVYHKSFGIGTIDPETPLQLDSQFRLASVSKPVTAMAVMILKERGILDYDEPISKYLPELPYPRVSIRHLLTHTSGIPDYTYLFERYWDPDHEIFTEKKYADNDDVIGMFIEHKPELRFDPGAQYSYSNTGYVFLASIVERASGMPFREFLRDNIFTPLGMSNTLLYSAIRDDPMERRVIGYRLALNGSDRLRNDFHYMSGISGDGAVYSTTGDLFKWDRGLYAETLVSQATLEEAFTPYTLTGGDKSQYGLGWGIDTSLVGRKVVTHGGGWIAARTWLFREIEDNNCIIVLTNHTSRHIYAIREALERILHDRPYDPLKPGIADIISPVLESKGVDAAIGEYYARKESGPDLYNFSQWELNYLGNRLVELGRHEEAIELFRLNAAQFPESSRVHSDLGEAVRLNGDTELAATHFRRSLELNPDNRYARQKLEEIMGSDEDP